MGQKAGSDAKCGGCCGRHQDLVLVEVEEGCFLEARGGWRRNFKAILKRQLLVELRLDGCMGKHGTRGRLDWRVRFSC